MKKDPKTMVVVVASNEPEARTENYEDTYELILKCYPNAVKMPIELGDIIYEGCGFELKNFGDLINSMMENNGERFRNQLLNMKNNQEMDWYYVIYGKWSDINKYSKFKVNAILGAIASIHAHYGVRCLILPNKQYAIYTISKIIEKYHDGKFVKPILHHATTDERAVNSISCLADKLGDNKAADLLKNLGTVKNVINSDMDKLMETKGIGKKIAERIIETINKDLSLNKTNETLKEIDKIIDFDIKNDKVSDKPKIDNIEKKTMLKEKIIKNEDLKKDDQKQWNIFKNLIYTIIRAYINKKFDDVPKIPLINGIRKKYGYNEEQINEALRDLEIESRIYITDQRNNEVYYNIY